jgi:hypothetical protein
MWNQIISKESRSLLSKLNIAAAEERTELTESPRGEGGLPGECAPILNQYKFKGEALKSSFMELLFKYPSRTARWWVLRIAIYSGRC